MAYSATQNPSNKVGRNSGAGPDGVTRVVPTEREAARGLKPISLGESRGWRRMGVGVGAGASALAVALLGVGAAWYRARHRPRGLRARLGHMVGRG